MAGPIDCRVSPTAVNRLALSKDITWFERHLISKVPWSHPGAGRRVYPGFIQLSAFISMNRQRHESAFREYYELLALADPGPEQQLKAQTTQTFYEEYLAVADLPAEFYLETVAQVFQTYALPRGELSYRGRRVRPEKIRRTALLTVEGERDDICSVGPDTRRPGPVQWPASLPEDAPCAGRRRSLRCVQRQALAEPDLSGAAARDPVVDLIESGVQATAGQPTPQVLRSPPRDTGCARHRTALVLQPWRTPMKRLHLVRLLGAGTALAMAGCAAPPAPDPAPTPAPAPAQAQPAARPAPAPPVARPQPAAAAPAAATSLNMLETILNRLAGDKGVTIERTSTGALLLRATGDTAFASGSANLSPRFGDFLRQVANGLQTYPSLSLKVTGHTDSTGDAQLNDRLSEARAAAAVNALVREGVAFDPAAVRGQGPERADREQRQRRRPGRQPARRHADHRRAEALNGQ